MRLVLFALLMLVTACTPRPTPFPVNLPTDLPFTATPPPAQAIRYGLHSNTNNALAEIERLAEDTILEQLEGPINENEPGIQYDIIAAYGDWSGWSRSEITPQAALLLNTTVFPLTEPRIVEMLRLSLDPQSLVTALAIPGTGAAYAGTTESKALHAELANMGYPDGFQIYLANGYVPGIDLVQLQLRAAGFESAVMILSDNEIRQAFSEGWLQMAVVLWTNSESHAAWVDVLGTANVIDLYSLPISYQVAPGLIVSFTPGGWPIARRS